MVQYDKHREIPGNNNFRSVKAYFLFPYNEVSCPASLTPPGKGFVRNVQGAGKRRWASACSVVHKVTCGAEADGLAPQPRDQY